MDDIHLKIKQARKNARLTQNDVAIACGVSRNAVTQWESINEQTRTRPSTENLITFCNVAGVEMSSLLSGKQQISENIKQYGHARKIKKETVKVQHLSAVGGMGSVVPIDFEHDSQVTTVELTKQYITSNLGQISKPDNLKLITAIGDSMQGVFDDGDCLFVDTGVNQFISETCYVIHFDDSIWIKRLQRDGVGGYWIISTGDGYKDIQVKKDNPTFRIIGLVVGKLGFNKL